MRRLLVLPVVLAAALPLVGLAASPAAAYGGGADHNMWQVGLSFNCDNPTPGACDQFEGTGGFWGWAEFDQSVDQTQTWGDAQFSFCFHTVGGGGGQFGAGAGHSSIDITSWTIEPGSAGPATFFVSGVETDTFRGERDTYPISHSDSGIPATPGHYTTEDVLGFTMPGLAVEVQITYRPAKGAASQAAAGGGQAPAGTTVRSASGALSSTGVSSTTVTSSTTSSTGTSTGSSTSTTSTGEQSTHADDHATQPAPPSGRAP